MKHLRCQVARPWRRTRVSVWLALIGVVAAVAGDAWAHWTITSTLTGADGGRTFSLALHYEVLAGQENADEALRICFWIERYREGRFSPVTQQSCEKLTLKATEWRTLVYSTERLAWRDQTGGSPLPRGQYRAVAVIESDVGWVTRMLWGAAQDRKALPFQIE